LEYFFFTPCSFAAVLVILQKNNMRPDHFQDPFHGKEGIYQFTMEHLEKARLFRSESDYDYGVNSIALAACEHPKTRVLCYSLMDNHLHLLLRGRYEDCQKFYLWLIRRLRIMLKQRYNVTGLLKDMAFDVSAITDDRMFINEVAYIIRNTYKARMYSPFSFPWNSADTYFNPLREAVRGTRFDIMQVSEVKALLQSHTKVPGNWEHIDGRILNRCFVDYNYVEKRIGDSLRFFDKIRLYDLESVINADRGLPESIVFTDMELQEKLQAICRNEYHVSSHLQLDRKTLLLLAKSLARRFGAPKTQISRMLGLSQDVLDKLL